MADLEGCSENDVVGRIHRYAAMRSVERALSPSIRARLPLAGAGRRQSLLLDLQRLLDSAMARGLDENEPAVDVARLREVDAAIDVVADRLCEVVRGTTLAQFRATLPEVVSSHRADAAALLDFWLDRMSPEDDPLHLIDYLITLMSTNEVEGRITVVKDPTKVSRGVMRAVKRVEAGATPPDAKRAREAAARLREASVSVLHSEDLEALIVEMRAFKVGLADVYFDRDLLRSVVQYNATVKNRFATLLEIDREHDEAILCTLEALRALDPPAREAAEGG